MKPPTQIPANNDCIIIVPTYKERANLELLHHKLNTHVPAAQLVIVDDASNDGTQTLIRKLQLQGHHILLFQRHAKLGLGTAYTLALAYARNSPCFCAVQMDADSSHDPADVPRLINACTSHHIAVGSRYTSEGRCIGWPLRRRILSKAANYLAKMLLKLPLADATGGFRCIRSDILQALPLHNITSEGFVFQCDFNNLAAKAKANFIEVPICFRQRSVGKSKMSLRIILGGLMNLIHINRRPHTPYNNLSSRKQPDKLVRSRLASRNNKRAPPAPHKSKRSSKKYIKRTNTT